MASPQQMPDPNRPTNMDASRRPADVHEMQTRDVRIRRDGVGWFAWWWVWLMVILCAIWFAGWGWGGYGGWWWGNRGSAYNEEYFGSAAGGAGALGSAGATGRALGSGAAANMNLVTGPGAAALSASDKRPYVGRRFQVSDAVVTKKMNDRVLWIGQGNDSGNPASMLVILEGAISANVSQGDLVNVTGRIAKAPAAAQAQSRWKLSSNGSKRLEQQGAYVAASRVQSVSSGTDKNH